MRSFGNRNFEGSKKKNLQVIAKYTVGDVSDKLEIVLYYNFN